MITTLSLRHAYMGPLDGGGARVSAIFLITKIFYVFCSVYISASYMFNHYKM